MLMMLAGFRCPAFRSSVALLGVLAAILAAPPGVQAQIVLPDKGESPPTFEVATVKPSSKDLGRSFHVHIWWDDNSYRTENTTLRDLIRTAFNATSGAQLAGGPDALLDERFDLNAKIGDEDYARLNKMTNEDRDRAVHLMLEALMADRFGLKIHTETRELPVFDLLVDKGASKLEPVADPAPAAASGAAGADAAKKPERNVSTHVSHNQATMKAAYAAVADLTSMLSRQPELDGRIVIDKTELTGKYNFTLQWSPQHLSAAPDPDAEGPSLFEALKQQLGLKLEAATGTVEVVVVDAVSAPTPN
jgi:uncharacterized protein (TIGR03435 family)